MTADDTSGTRSADRALHILVEPATERPITTLSLASAADVDAAVERAHAAQREWAATAPSQRAELLLALSEAIAARAQVIADMEARNVGMPISDAHAEVGVAAACFRYFAGAAERHLGYNIPVEGGVDLTFREPVGVVGLITPWNFPLAIACWKIAPALAAGTAVVHKPSELTPLTALELSRLAREVGLAEGLLEVVVGDGPTVGRQLVEHPCVPKVSFTGSTRVGREIAGIAGRKLKRVTLELGGKSANVIFADADLAKAAAEAPMAVFGNAGQDCCARSRLLVQASVMDRFVEMFEESMRGLVVGDPLSPATHIGPLISEKHRRRVASFLDDDIETIVKLPSPEGPGYWFAPRLVRTDNREHRVLREEIFGPVAALIPFADEAEAAELANDTGYGLSGSLWTRDLERAMRFSRRVQAGTLSVNCNTSVRVQTPFGGLKQSGLGREMGPDALDEYTETKNVFFYVPSGA